MEKKLIAQPLEFKFLDTIQLISFLQHFGVTEMVNWELFSRHLSDNFDIRHVLEAFPGRFNFQELSANTSIVWNAKMIADYYNQIHWKNLSSNKSVQFSDPDILKRYENKFDWDLLSGNPGFSHDIPTIQKYESRINWKKLGSQLKVFIVYINIADFVSDEEIKQTEIDFALLLHYKPKWCYKREIIGYDDQPVVLANSIFDNSEIDWRDEHIRKHFYDEIDVFNTTYKKCI